MDDPDPDAVLDAFGVRPVADRFADAALIADDDSAGAIAAALLEAAQAAGLDPLRAARRPGPRRKCVVGAVGALYRAGAYRDCAHLAVASGETHRRVRAQTARALEALSATEALSTYLATCEADPDLPAALRRNFLDIRLHSWLGLTSADHRVFVPPSEPETGSDKGESVPGTLAEALARLPAPGINWIMPRMEAGLLRLRGLDTAGQEAAAAEFLARLRWGRAAQDYISFLGHYLAPRARARPAPGPEGPRDHARIRALADQIGDLMDLPDTNPMAEAAAKGRSVALMSAHAGLPTLAPAVIWPTGLPLIGISASAPTDLADPVIKTVGARGNFNLDMVRAVKILRREPHVIEILPDGGFGGVPVMQDLLGRQIPLGPGAEMMVWQGRAATFFFSTHWRDGRIAIRLQPGPVANGGDDAARAAFRAEFYGFYMARLKEIVLGPPENMAPGGGFWPHLTAG
ncbi:MAG: hypothetical protein ACWA5A_10735 [Marinibacterium sp.]